MSKILKVSESDYRLVVQSGGTITLDTGTTTGTVIITGNLDVKGTTTTVESTNTTVKDNIIQINYGQTGNGISSALDYQAGIQIGRGNYADAKLVFDETVYHYDQVEDDNFPGTFSFQYAGGGLASIQVASIAASTATNLNFDLQNATNVLEIVNADPASYSSRVQAGDGNVIPNKKYLEDFVSSGLIVVGQADVDRIYKGHGTSPVVVDSEVIATNDGLVGTIKFLIRSGGFLNQRAIITETGLSVDDLSIYQHSITNTGTYPFTLSSPDKIVLVSTDTNEVEVDSVLNLTNQTDPVSATGGKTKIYSQALAGPGKSGIFFANNTTSDELVSKNRAVLLSILL